ncbi:MAG TPA: glycosyltransferase [Pirellulales bacterium]|nr:glycosyltransferase [Pirellulales bacterium]
MAPLYQKESVEETAEGERAGLTYRVGAVESNSSMAPSAPTRRSLKVAHVVVSLDVGGLERLVVDLVREATRLGNESVVICLERPGDLAKQAEELGAPVYCIHKRAGLRPATVPALARLFRQLHPDVVHCHQIGALVYAGLAARRAKVRAVVHTEHGKHYSSRLRTRLLGRLASHYADRFCCVSYDIAQEVRHWRIVAQRKIATVPNGIDIGRFVDRRRHVPRTEVGRADSIRRELGIPPEAPVVGTVGRLHQIKRQDVLIRAFAKSIHPESSLAGEATPAAHLLLVGDGPRRADLERLAAELLPDARIHFAGYQAAPEHYLALMDVFVLSSESEGMPLSILEAWAAGVPVVSSAVGGVPELVADGETGILFPPGDMALLANCLKRLLSDRELADRLTATASERVRRDYSLARTAERYQRLYQELTG